MRNPFDTGDRAHSLGRIVSSCVCDYSACSLNSYLGSGNFWRNMEENYSPAETDAYSAGGLFIGGVSSTIPTLNGVAGFKGTGFSLDGGDFFYHSGLDDSVPKILGDTHFADFWHRNQPFTVVMSLLWQANALSQTLFATKAPGINKGLIGNTTSTNNLSITQRGDTDVTTVNSSGFLTHNAKHIISIDHKFSDNTTGFRINTNVRNAVSQTFNGSVNKASTPLIFGASINTEQTVTSLLLANGTVIYDIALFNDVISDGNFTSIINAIEHRNGMSFI